MIQRILSSKTTMAKMQTNVVTSLTLRLVTSSITTTVRLCFRRKIWTKEVKFLLHLMLISTTSILIDLAEISIMTRMASQ